MIIQEPVHAAIWHCLNNYAYSNAIFLAERLYAEVFSDDALYLLATCYYRAGKTASAYSVLHTRGSQTSQCRFLLARCCVDLKKFAEAETALTKCGIAKSKGLEEIVSEFGDTASFAVELLGQICAKTERHGKAAEAFRKSLKLNPFLWSSYESLINLGEMPDPAKIFSISNIDNFSMCQGMNPMVSFLNKTGVDYVADEVKDSSKLSVVPLSSAPANVNTPLTVINMMPQNSSHDVVTPDNGHLSFTVVGRSSNCVHPKMPKTTFTGCSFSPLTPSFGILPLESPSNTSGMVHSPLVYVTPSTPTLIETMDPRAPLKKSVPRKNQAINPHKFQIFGQSGNNNSLSITQTPTPQASLQSGGLSNVRRSSRLFSSSNSVKENNKSSSKTSRLVSSKTPSKKTKTRTSKGSLTQPKESELNELNKTETQSENRIPVPSATSVSHTAISMQKASADGLMQLLQELGWAKLHLGRYHCKKAIDILNALPPHQYRTGWVLATLGRAYFELAEYEQANKLFEEVQKLEPHRLQGMEYYSTALWHLQQEVALSALAQDLVEFDKSSPETWCTAGNCFSLQKEHETAIKFLQRAVLMDPEFAYSYTLLGHEYVLTEEMDKAMACFRNAVRIDPRHYNAWYGIGMIYYKQEKFLLAEMHFNRAHVINPLSSVLMCNIGVAQHALKKTEESLNTLNKAIALDPKNPLCKFHRATINFSLDRHQEALQELEELKEIVPKESLVYFLIGKVHKKLGNADLALMNFSWAMELDPKGSNNQIKEAIDKRFTNDDEEIVAVHELTTDDVGSVGSGAVDQESSHGSSMVDLNDMQLQAMESDEGF